jgi:hypothetical protein
MSHPVEHIDDDDGLTLKPQPYQRHTFDLSSEPPSPSGRHSPNGLEPLKTTTTGSSMTLNKDGGNGTPARNRSFLNLTASTLFGIYQPNELQGESTQPTPLGLGSQTPTERRYPSFDWSRIHLPSNAYEPAPDGGGVRRKSFNPASQQPRAPRRGFTGYFLPLVGRVTLLFSIGCLYGLLISHLHDRQLIASVPGPVDDAKWSYLVSWGLAGIALGEALPWLDRYWARLDDGPIDEGAPAHGRGRRLRDARGGGWLDIVRSIGLFVGIAFAIRKLPWQSTLQLSLTLALANPAVWYLIDGSPPGFILSTAVALAGTAVLVGINPSLVSSPRGADGCDTNSGKQCGVNGTVHPVHGEHLVLGLFSQESIGVATWIASVLFVSSVCFGNIGRKLAA